ncbi:type II toxin-antitoxin system Phd/YefM family antitoxin [Sphingomonas radiodurans]|uniref:type II toxin-antitoxin system Phd/YefM family antitoxin n=1 Tax=Sphingomonas radiodurans TaxID=2890321 RepID=UPI001E5621EF|nr:type II toxin-antitoxin system prevent-host-death family antitoxin [Sphingomonas radiodurans]WBH15610.1 type II toxin-antitoxin system prevent-host-death family antitoxin [Sphingomonas radiodurans]
MGEVDPQKTFNVHEAKTHFSKLIERAHAGEEIILAKAGEPWAKLVPYAEPKPFRRKPGGLRLNGPLDLSVFLEPMDEEELAYIDDRPPEDRT